MRRKSLQKIQNQPGYFLQYERCIKQHHFSPKIFICVEERCEHKNLLCHYCINDSFHNYTQQNFLPNAEDSSETDIINHTGHKIIPIEEYINLFRNLYYNGKLQQPTSPNISSSSSLSSPKFSKVNTSANNDASNSVSSTQSNKDWKENSQQKYLKYLKCLKNQISEIYQFVEEQIQESEQMIMKCFQNLSNHEKEIEECCSYFDSKEGAVSSDIVQQFVNNSFHFLIDSQSRLKCSKSGGGYLELSEYNQSQQDIQLITQKDIQTKIFQQFNHIKKVADYFQTISNDLHKKFQNGLISTPFFESPVALQNQISNDNANLQLSPIKIIDNQLISSPTLPNPESSQILSSYSQQILSISPVTFGKNLNLPENLFTIRSPGKKLSEIHSKSIWRVVHLQKSLCASCSSDGTIKIWDLKTQKVIKIFNSFNDAVNDLIYLSKQRLLISVSGDNKIRIFSLTNYKCIRVIEGHLNAIYTCHYDPFKNLLLTAGREEEVYGWNILTGERVLKTKSIQRSIYSLQSVSLKDSFLCGDEGGTLTIFNYNKPQQFRNQTIHSKTIYSIKVVQIQNVNNSKDMQIVTCSADGFVKITSFDTLEVLNQVKLNSFIYDISIHMNRIFAQVGKTANLAIIGLTQQRGNIEVSTKLIALNNPNKVRCLHIVKDQNILLYESTQNDISFDINIEQF